MSERFSKSLIYELPVAMRHSPSSKVHQPAIVDRATSRAFFEPILLDLLSLGEERRAGIEGDFAFAPAGGRQQRLLHPMPAR